MYFLSLEFREKEKISKSRSQRMQTPKYRYYPIYRYYEGRRHITEGDEVDFYDPETGEYRHGEIESISGDEVEIYDYEQGEYKYVDIDDVD